MSAEQSNRTPGDVDTPRTGDATKPSDAPKERSTLSEMISAAPGGRIEFEVLNPENVDDAMGVRRAPPPTSSQETPERRDLHWLDELRQERTGIGQVAGALSHAEQQRIVQDYIASHPRGKTVLRVALLTNVLHVLASTVVAVLALIAVTVLWLIGLVPPISILITFAAICTVGVFANITGIWAAQLTEWDEMVRVEAGRLRTNTVMLLVAAIAICLMLLV